MLSRSSLTTLPLHRPHPARDEGSGLPRLDLAHWQGRGSRKSIPLPGNGEGGPYLRKSVQVGGEIERRNGEGRSLDWKGGSVLLDVLLTPCVLTDIPSHPLCIKMTQAINYAFTLVHIWDCDKTFTI